MKRSKKFIEKETRQVNLLPKTANQQEYITALRGGVKLVIATGHAGVGKTFCAAYHAAEMYLRGHIQKIIVARPYVSLGKDIGHLPGTEYEKLYPFVRNMLDTLEKVVGTKYKYMLDNGHIEVQPIEKIQGRSFDERCIVICDETQNVAPNQMRSLVTRIGEGCQMILCGDPRQTCIKGLNGLDYIVKVIQDNNIQDTSIIHFSEDDIVRSGMVRDFIIAFEKEGGLYGV
jgi:phosphate starvation-inducible protein PhoH and related proteins